MSARDFAMEYEQRARDAGVPDDVAKTLLVAALNEETIQRLDSFIAVRLGAKVPLVETCTQRLEWISYQ